MNISFTIESSKAHAPEEDEILDDKIDVLAVPVVDVDKSMILDEVLEGGEERLDVNNMDE